jgi:hypothetical protein
MFGATGEADVDGLFADASAVVAFDLTFSTGFKITDLQEFFKAGKTSSDISIPSLFLRIDDLGVFAEASLDDITLDLFPGIAVDDGNFLISSGIRLDAPFEATLDVVGNLDGIGFNATMKSRLDFTPYGQLYATLPFTANVNGYDQELKILFEDSNLFDSEALLVKVDFDACQVASFLDGMLAKLGSLTLSPDSILGPVSLAVDFGKSLDSFFPNAGEFVEGVLEGELCCNNCIVLNLHIAYRFGLMFLSTVAKNELFHLCAEAEESGLPGPTLEDVLSMILEDVLGETSSLASSNRRLLGLNHESVVHHHRSINFTKRHPRGRRTLRSTHPKSSYTRQRALRAHHLPYNHFTRPRSSLPKHRKLTSSGLDDLLDSLSISGGYNGNEIFIKFGIDLSKNADIGLDTIITKPLELLKSQNFMNELELFSGNYSSTLFSFDSDISFSAGVHIGAIGESTLCL